MSLFKSSKVIGLDIGNNSIKLAELDISKRGATLLSFGIAPTPRGVLSSRGEISDPLPLSEAVMQIVDQVKTKRKSAVTGIWGSAVMIKKITVPRMERGLLQEQIKWEAEQYIPFDVNEINLDFHILSGSEANPEMMDVLLIAAQKEYIFKFAEVVETSGLQCSILDVSGFALANCVQFNYGPLPGEVVAILNIGAGITNFVVSDNSDVVFCRDIPVGGQNFTAEIQQQLAVSTEEAEALKISATTGAEAPQEVSDIIKSTCDYVSEEIHRSVDFYAATANEHPIQRLMVTGGGSLTPGLLESLQNLTSIKPEVFNPFHSIGYSTKNLSADYIGQITPFVSVSLGLGLRKLGDG